MNRKTLKALFLIVTSAVAFAGCRKTNNLDYDNVAKQEQQKEESKEQETVELTYDIYKDIKNGALYVNSDGRITDINGHLIDYYKDVTRDGNGMLVKDGINPFGNYIIDENGKVCINEALASGASDETIATSKKVLKANPLNVDRRVVGPVGNGKYEGLTFMEYDGDVLDELLSGAWFDSSGNPLAECLPERISDTFPLPTVMAKYLRNFTFVDGKKCTMQQMLRKSPSYDYSYALLIKNIDKQVTVGGDRYNYATEYYSGKKIMFTGDFTKMLNGDSAIMFGIYKGTDINDIPGFDAYFLEFHNGDF